MDCDSNVKENLENVNKNVVQDVELKKLREELTRQIGEYQKTIKYMSADAPVSILCLPAKTQSILSRHGCDRVYDMLDLDFTKIEGLGIASIRDLTSRLEKFLSML